MLLPGFPRGQVVSLSAWLSRSLWRSDHIFPTTRGVADRGVWHMASEDSVNDFFQASLSLLSIMIHGVSQLDDFHQTLTGVVTLELKKLYRLEIPGDVGLPS